MPAVATLALAIPVPALVQWTSRRMSVPQWVALSDYSDYITDAARLYADALWHVPVTGLAFPAWLISAPLCLALLSQTLGRANIKRRQLLRCWCYSAWTLVISVPLPAMIYAVEDVLASHFGVHLYLYDDTYFVEYAIPLGVFSFGMVVFWWSVAGRYLLLPHPMGIALAINVIPAQCLLLVNAIWVVALAAMA